MTDFGANDVLEDAIRQLKNRGFGIDVDTSACIGPNSYGVGRFVSLSDGECSISITVSPELVRK